MDVLQKLKELKQKSGWTDYKIAKEAGLSPNTVSNVFVRNNTPRTSTLEAICKAFGITLSQFFAEDNLMELTDEQKVLLAHWSLLTASQKDAVLQIIKSYTK